MAQKRRNTTTISLDYQVYKAVSEAAIREKRSVTRQIEVLLEAALGRDRGLERPVGVDVPEAGITA